MNPHRDASGRTASVHPPNEGDRRWCSGCERFKPLGQFYADRRTRDGLTRRCRDCHSRKSYEARQQSDAPHARRGYDKLRRGRRFGLSPEDLAAIESAQDGRCAICLEPETEFWKDGTRKNLAIDHDHESGRVRGLLCGQCNTALGKFRDDPARLRRAADYVESSCCEGEPQ